MYIWCEEIHKQPWGEEGKRSGCGYLPKNLAISFSVDPTKLKAMGRTWCGRNMARTLGTRNKKAEKNAY